jgi:hypothetical protein
MSCDSLLNGKFVGMRPVAFIVWRVVHCHENPRDMLTCMCLSEQDAEVFYKVDHIASTAVSRMYGWIL